MILCRLFGHVKGKRDRTIYDEEFMNLAEFSFSRCKRCKMPLLTLIYLGVPVWALGPGLVNKTIEISEEEYMYTYQSFEDIMKRVHNKFGLGYNPEIIHKDKETDSPLSA